ncbi:MULTISPECIES: nucleotidyltransferase family protein [unclassified Blastococcus]
MTSYRDQAMALLLDDACRSIAAHLTRAEIDFIMLKGATIAGWLYDDLTQRTYVDLDVLVAPDTEAAAVRALAELGYRPLLDAPTRAALSPEEQPLQNRHGVDVDLHVTLTGVRVDPSEAWRSLRAETVPWQWAGTTVPALSVPARTMHLALHLAQKGLADEKAARDLGLGLERLDDGMWRAAADLAERLHALDAFTAGLSLLPAGAELIRRLGFAAPSHVETRMRAASASYSALVLERAAVAQPWGSRLRLVSNLLFPSAEWFRFAQPERTRTPGRLLWARVARPVEVLARTPRAFQEWRRHRRASGAVGRAE